METPKIKKQIISLVSVRRPQLDQSVLFRLRVQRSSVTTPLRVRSVLLFCSGHICSRSALIISKQGARDGGEGDAGITVLL